MDLFWRRPAWGLMERVHSATGLSWSRVRMADWRDEHITPLEAWYRNGGHPVLLNSPLPFLRLNPTFPEPLDQRFPRVRALRMCLQGRPVDDAAVIAACAAERRAERYISTASAPWMSRGGRRADDGPDSRRSATPSEIWLHAAKDVAESIQRRGYHRSSSPGGDIKGVLLTDGERACVLLSGGKHRAVALAALGWDALPVRLFYHPRFVVRRDECGAWPGVASGVWTPDDALRLFDSVLSGGEARDR